jgi:Fibronectin type III domain
VAASTYLWKISGVKPGPGQEISNATLSGCWNASQVKAATAQATGAKPPVEINASTGAVKVDNLNDNVLPVTVSITYMAKYVSAGTGTTAFLKTGTGSTGGITSTVAGPTCQPPLPPSAPTNVIASRGNASATLSWTTPISNYSPITDYKVYVSTGAVIDTHSTATSTVVSALTNGTPYTFTVSALNVVGEGARSAPSNPVTPATVPGAQTGVTAARGDQSATVSWTAPISNGSAITGYTVYLVNPDNTLTPAASVGGSTSSTTRRVAYLVYVCRDLAEA